MDEGTSVLIVDDNDAIREYLTTVIENIGYSAYSAPDGEKALEFLHNNSIPDLILLDVIMPGLNGIDVLRQIKSDPHLKNIIIIMVTGVHHIAEKELAFMLGASDFIEKPFESRELIARVRTHINLKKASEKCVIQRKIQETILSTIPGIVYLKDKDGTYIHGNGMFADLTGTPQPDLAGKTEYELFPEKVASEREKTDGLILKVGIPEIEMQEEITTGNGETRTYFTRKRPVFNRNNEITGLVGVSIDITEQVILKEAYYEKEELLTAILNSYPAEIWVINPDGDIILQNYDHLKINGNLIGKNIREVPLPEDTRRKWEESLKRAIQGKNQKSEEIVIRPDGDEWIMNEFRPVQADDRTLGAMGINLNLTRWNQSDLNSDPSSHLIMPGSDSSLKSRTTSRSLSDKERER